MVKWPLWLDNTGQLATLTGKNTLWKMSSNKVTWTHTSVVCIFCFSQGEAYYPIRLGDYRRMLQGLILIEMFVLLCLLFVSWLEFTQSSLLQAWHTLTFCCCHSVSYFIRSEVVVSSETLTCHLHLLSLSRIKAVHFIDGREVAGADNASDEKGKVRPRRNCNLL